MINKDDITMKVEKRLEEFNKPTINDWHAFYETVGKEIITTMEKQLQEKIIAWATSEHQVNDIAKLLRWGEKVHGKEKQETTTTRNNINESPWTR